MPSVLITEFMGDDTALEEQPFCRAGCDVHVAASPEPEEWFEVATVSTPSSRATRRFGRRRSIASSVAG